MKRPGMGRAKKTTIETLRRIHRTSSGHAEFITALGEAVSDGHLTPDEIMALDALRLEFDISFDEFWKLRIWAYRLAVEAAVADREITSGEESQLEQLREYLGLTAEESRLAVQEIQGYRRTL